MATALYSEVWDLDVFFEGGSSSGDFAVHIDQTKQLIDEFIALTEGWQPSSAEQDQQTLLNLIGKFEGTTKKLRQAGAFVSCLEAQNMADSKANELRAAVTVLSAGFQNALTDFDEKLAGFSDEDWKAAPAGGWIVRARVRPDRAPGKGSRKAVQAGGIPHQCTRYRRVSQLGADV